MLLLQQAEDVQSFKLFVCHGSNAGIKFLLRQLFHLLDAIFMLNDGRIGPWVVNRDVEVVFL